MIKLLAYLLGLGVIWSVTICLLKQENIMNDVENFDNKKEIRKDNL